MSAFDTASWNSMTLKQKFEYLLGLMCKNVACDAVVSNVFPSSAAADVVITWDESGTVSFVNIIIDGVVVGTVSGGVKTFTAIGFADGNKHGLTVQPICANGVIGSGVDTAFGFLGCPKILPPTHNVSQVDNVPCPYDLTQQRLSVPQGTTIEWHFRNDTNPNTIVADPTAVVTGTYYAFAVDAAGCKSVVPFAFTVNCAVTGSCTPAQSVEVISFGGSSHLVRFSSALFPPPTYTVRRRLTADADVPGSYTTLGQATWNVGMSKWVLDDTTALDNVLYTYVVDSDCAGGAVSAPGVDYVSLTCPTVTITHNTGTNVATVSFPPLGGSITAYVIGWSTLGAEHTPITITPPFSNPITHDIPGVTDPQNTLVEVYPVVNNMKVQCPGQLVTPP